MSTLQSQTVMVGLAISLGGGKKPSTQTSKALSCSRSIVKEVTFIQC